jgi:hypothetical protein
VPLLLTICLHGSAHGAAGDRHRQTCARLLPAATAAFAGLYPAIEQKLPLANF